MTWKAVYRRILIVLLLILLGVEVVMELRYSCDEISVASTDTERILRRTPEVVITEEDKALMAELLEVPSVRALVESGENRDIRASEDSDVLAAAGQYLDEGIAESLNVSALFFEDEYAVFLGWRDGEQLFYFQQTPEGEEVEYYKCYSPKRGTSYESWDNKRAQKSEVHRRWLAWLRDGMWKDA